MLALVGLPLNAIGIIGLLLLLGIVKKNGIMLVDFAQGEEKSGRSARDATYDPWRALENEPS